MKRFALAMVLLGMFVGPTQAQEEEEKKLLAVCSTTQVADFARQVVGDRWDVQCVLAAGQDPPVYEVKPGDARLVAQAAICLENGWHLEGNEWMKTLAKDAGKPIVSCVTGLKPLELVEDGETIDDPHAWFSPKNAAVYVNNIARGVSQIDPEHADEYKARADFYVQQLRTLHVWIQKEVNSVPKTQRKLITSHDAFNYFCSEYGFTSAAPAGWSTGDEVGGGITAERRQQSIKSIRDFGIKAIFVETSTNPEMIRQIAADAGVKIGGELYADSMGAPGTAGESYLGMMRENVLKITRALSAK